MMKDIDPTIVKSINTLFSSVRWLFSKQNRDGSWGGNLKEKVRWTSNAVYTLSFLGFVPKRSKKFKQAIEWLKGIPITHDEWFLRIPALSAVGLGDWLHQSNDYSKAKELFRQDLIGQLPFKTALAMELLSEGIDVPNLELITNSILVTLRREDQDLLSFGGSTNNTTLYANFLKCINYEDQNLIEKCIRWVKIRATEKSGGSTLCWEESYGKTAYVIINLIELIDNVHDIEDIVLKTLNYFQPLKNGAIPSDRIPAHESRSSIYTTILFIRVIGTLFKHDVRYYESAFKALIMGLILNQKLFHGWIRKLAPIAFPASICFAAAILLYFLFGKDFIFSVLSSIAAGVIISLYFILKKIIYSSQKRGLKQ